MNKAILALFLIFNLYTALSQTTATPGATGTTGLVGPTSGVYGGDIAKDFIDKYAGNFINSTTATTNPAANPVSIGKPETSLPNTTTTTTTTTTTVPPTPASTTNLSDFGSKGFYANFTCPQAINKTNQAISELSKAATNATDLFSLYGAAQKLNGMSEFLNYGCDLTGFKLVNVGQTGLNQTQDDACAKLIGIISPLVDPTATGVSASDYKAALGLSQQAFGLAGSLGDQCNITFVDPAHPLVVQNPPVNPPVNTQGPIVTVPGTESSPGFKAVEVEPLTNTVPFSSFVQAKLTYLRKLL